MMCIWPQLGDVVALNVNLPGRDGWNAIRVIHLYGGQTALAWIVDGQ
jgi:hypothetical protein